MDINELTKDAAFINQIDKEIKKISLNRLKRPAPAAGFYYKRDWFDRMRDSRHLSTEFFINNMDAVLNNRSLLGSEERKIVKLVCETALCQYLAEPIEEVQEEGLTKTN